MYFCTLNASSRVMICTSSSIHWQQASKLSALQHFELTWKDQDKNVPINTEIIIITLYFTGQCVHFR